MRTAESMLQSRIPKAVRSTVEVVDASTGRCECNICGQVWFFNLRTGGRMFRGWWKCSNGCTDRALEAQAETQAVTV
jgi:hypothetical protein